MNLATLRREFFMKALSFFLQFWPEVSCNMRCQWHGSIFDERFCDFSFRAIWSTQDSWPLYKKAALHQMYFWLNPYEQTCSEIAYGDLTDEVKESIKGEGVTPCQGSGKKCDFSKIFSDWSQLLIESFRAYKRDQNYFHQHNQTPRTWETGDFKVKFARQDHISGLTKENPPTCKRVELIKNAWQIE